MELRDKETERAIRTITLVRNGIALAFIMVVVLALLEFGCSHGG